MVFGFVFFFFFLINPFYEVERVSFFSQFAESYFLFEVIFFNYDWMRNFVKLMKSYSLSSLEF